MRDLSEIRVAQVRLFKPDVIPLRRLLSQLGSGGIMAAFGFRDSGVNDSGELVFQSGTLVASPGSKSIWIGAIAFSERKIVLQVEGSSADANEVFLALSNAVDQITPGRQPIAEVEPAILVEETTCVVTLDLHWSDLLAPRFRDYLESTLRELGSGGATPFLKVPSIRFQIGYLTPPERAIAGVTIADKFLSIEPRIDVPLEERRFIVHSPTDSESHFKLIETLESLLKPAQ